MQMILNELFFRFVYAVLCIISLYALHYVTYGWQCEYFLAMVAYSYESADYSFSESVTWDTFYSSIRQSSVKPTTLTVTQSWGAIYYTSAIYFYSLTSSNVPWFCHNGLFACQIAFVIYQAYAFTNPGLIQPKHLIFKKLWVLFLCYYTPSSVMWLLSLQEEWSIERLDSELQPYGLCFGFGHFRAKVNPKEGKRR